MNVPDRKVISFIDNKAALTDHMHSLIKEVMQQSGNSEAQRSSSEKDPSKEVSDDVTHEKTKKKNVSGIEKPRKKIKAKSSSEQEVQKENTIKKSVGEQAPAKKKSSKKEKEIAKSHAADEAAKHFFKANGNRFPSPYSNAEKGKVVSPLLSMSPPKNVTTSDRRPMYPVQPVGIQANSATVTSQCSPFSSLSLTPLSSVSPKYNSFTPQPFRDEDVSMLGLLGSSPSHDLTPGILQTTFHSRQARSRLLWVHW